MLKGSMAQYVQSGRASLRYQPGGVDRLLHLEADNPDDHPDPTEPKEGDDHIYYYY